ncbi:DUF4178 domain-containing protein [Ramlibacter sp. USB13]|uniref:DUF4178 domain-containing protein n=1 Tax=Ramlibacter cellulosilyticus TaxID=2764187 RepID=A0A923MPZ5_9BURK|nr:DUF4178 domain-containing protein [Ramlibacter cellulosilyticus]MBC5782718.1 DUF4178 domain-containing protein [Ramlibacter cellulosilyticus]
MATQRSYTAPCPGCGAPVEFRSAQSAFAVCSYCRSTVARQGEVLSRIGKMAELFDNHSPLQLHARGVHEGRPFALVGRLQYRAPSGPWTEWHCLFEDGGTAWLAEDNGQYVLSFPASTQREVPQPSHFRIGATTAINGNSYQVASNEQVRLVAAEGELPRLPAEGVPFAMLELRSAGNEVLSVDYGSTPPSLARGRPVALEELRFTGLREQSEKTEQGRQFACPHCGAQVTPRFADSKAITCPACKSLIDLTQGLGGELRHAEQDEPVEPLIPLGTVGKFKGREWQVVGYQHRLGTEPDDPDEHFGWDEYLLYNRTQGFSFLLDTSDGWSFVKTLTGAPQLSSDLTAATWLGTRYQQQYAYDAQVTFVEGEFYWPVERGQRTFNRDYAAGGKQLSLEETPRERTWSAGTRVDSDEVARAFGLWNRKDLLARGGGDAGPVTAAKGGLGCGCGTLFLILLVLAFLVVVLRACDEDCYRNPDGTLTCRTSSGSSYRSSGGSWSGGGSHK